MVGDFNGWNLDTALEVIKQEDGTYKATTVYKSDEAGFKYKYINELGWDYEEINHQGWDNRYIC